MTTTTTSPRIYVDTYRKYNSGSIAGKWLDLAEFEDYDAFVQACKDLHSDEADPEFMIQDFEGFPKMFYSESGLPTEETFDFLRSLADELDEDKAEAFSDYCENLGSYNVSIDSVLSDFEEAYQGEYTKKEFAEHIAEEMGMYDAMEKAGINAAYFDVEAYGRDLFCGDYYRTENGHVFRNL